MKIICAADSQFSTKFWNLFELELLFSGLSDPSFKNLKLIRVTGMESSPAWPGHPTTTIEQAFEGSDSYNHLQCYVSATPTGGDHASIDIEKAWVSQIKLLNRGDGCCGT